jgi:hypothetical protein
VHTVVVDAAVFVKYLVVAGRPAITDSAFAGGFFGGFISHY